MAVIYEPQGKAREYSPRAINIYRGCQHGCVYCYVPRMLNITPDEFRHRPGVNKSWDPEVLRRECQKIEGTSVPVFFSFTSDPYPDTEMSEGHTRKALEILRDYHVPAIILTKSGTRSLRDLDLWKTFEGRLKYGATLTTLDIGLWVKWERMSPRTEDRMEALEAAHHAGVRTWASIEPVYDAEESLSVIRETLGYVDEYRVGCISGHPEVYDSIDWPAFTAEAVKMLRFHGKRFYIKSELAKVAKVALTPEESVLALNDSFCGEWTPKTRETQGQLIK